MSCPLPTITLSLHLEEPIQLQGLIQVPFPQSKGTMSPHLKVTLAFPEV